MEKLLNLVKSHWTFIKFLIVGGLNTAFGYIVFALFIWLGAHYSLASFLSTVLGIIFNFFTTSKLVFKNSKLSLFFKFFAVYVFCWYIAVIFIHFYKIFIGNNEYLAGFIILFPNAIISYTLMKYYVFKSNNKNSL